MREPEFLITDVAEMPEVRLALIRRLEEFPGSEQVRMLFELVRADMQEVLRKINREIPGQAAADRPFREIGLDSLGLIELHARLNASTGLGLPVTVAFEYPTARLLADFLRAELFGRPGGEPSEPVPARDHSDEPIAIVAIGCRFPGGITSADDLWDLVAGGQVVLDDFPADRGWDLDQLFGTDAGRPGTSAVRTGGFLATATEFDADFFGIGPREALAMDPQQRLVLEVAWEALERIGTNPSALRGSRTGVFISTGVSEYGLRPADAPAELSGYLGTGGSHSVVSGRVAYTFGLEGPAVTIDTACSGSLVALHLACASLRRGECTLALAGGVTVLSGAGMFTEFSKQRGLALDGRIKAFSSTADGTNIAEGAGLLVVERLSDALRAEHPVLAVVRGSAVNSDGASNGLTAPSGPAQRRVIRQALADAGLSADQVDVVEAHGTGTRLGDPIEAQALLATYGQDRPDGRPLWLGSVKSNLGHTQAAAGAAGVIKMIQAMRHRWLPQTLHVDAPTTDVDWSAGAVRLLTDPVPWEPDGRPRRAGVSSFGISGTNAHIILEEPPAPEMAAPEMAAPEMAAPEMPAVSPLIISAKSEAALRAQAGRLRSLVLAQPELALPDLGYSLATTRSAMAHRAVLLAAGRAELTAGLDSLAAGQDAAYGRHGVADGSWLAFMFTGQGSQRAGQGRELYQRYPVFAEALTEAIGHLDLHLVSSLWDVLFAEEDAAAARALDQTAFAQAGLFALEVALFRLVESWGLRPDFVLGHSVGELAAAHVAGVLSLADAAMLVGARGRLMQALPAGGAMVAVQASEQEVAGVLPAGVGLAAVNGPASVVLSGAAAGVAQVAERFAGLGRRVSWLRVSHAFHSPLMEPMLAEFRHVVRVLDFCAPAIPLVSTLTGRVATAEELRSPDYWVRHVREPVRFADSIGWLADQGAGTVLELGPDAVLAPMAADCVAERRDPPVFASVLRRGGSEVRELLSAVALAHVRGAGLDGEGLFAGTGARRVPLPAYAFQRRRFWLTAPAGHTDVQGLGQAPARHPMLGAVVVLAGSAGAVLTGHVGRASHPWLADHVISGVTLLPATAFAELAVRAADQVGCDRVEELTLQAPLVLPDGEGGVALQVVVGARDETGRHAMEIHSRADDDPQEAPWTLHAQGVLIAEPAGRRAGSALTVWPPPDATRLDVSSFYADLHDQGYGYGPAFQGLQAAWRRGEDIFAEVALPEQAGPDAASFGMHPALMDAAMHAVMLTGPGTGPLVPFVFNGITLHATGASALRVWLRPLGDDQLTIAVADDSGRPVATVESLVSRSAQAGRSAAMTDALLRVEWIPIAVSAAASALPLLRELDGTTQTPDTVLYECPDGTAASTPDRVREVALEVLHVVQAWLADERNAASRLVVLTRGAVVLDDGRPDLAQAPVWGLVRAAQAEYPGRLVLIDTDGPAASPLLAAVARSAEPQLAVRGDVVRIPRLTRIPASSPGTPPWNPDGTVLITGGTGGLGARVARHLVTEHGVRRLLLTSRQGIAAPGARELQAGLTALGADVTVAECDVTDRPGLARQLAAIPAAYPLTAVVHTAGILDDALIGDLTAERLTAVLAPKVDGAWNLHELTKDRDLSAFVLFSSTAAVLDPAGQGNYAAANTFLDVLAADRHQAGLAATSIQWALWTDGDGMGVQVDEVAVQRLRYRGFVPLHAAEYLARLDLAVAGADPLVAVLRIDPQVLRTRGDEVPEILRGLVPGTPRRSAGASGRLAAGSLAQRLDGLDEAGRHEALLDLVRARAAAVLGHDTGTAVSAARAFNEMGFDSLAAVELRNQLNAATGLRLTATMTFDYPTPKALAEHLADKIFHTAAVAGGPAPTSLAEPDEPIVIVGMACRYPGQVASPEDLWRLLADGRDAISDFPADRGWSTTLYDPEPGKPGKSYTRTGGFLDDPAAFDADFFRISPREAQAMDPQQRLLLETSWETLERAGVDPHSLAGRDVGVFTGVMYHDWGLRLGPLPEDVAAHAGLGSLSSAVSGRVSYTLGLEGPAVTVDTACSSSLVAMHWATQALQRGECSLALAGGVTVMSTPDTFVDMARQRGLAADGRCKSFGAGADGTGWGEGVGMLLLERLSDAKRNGHQILALVRGSAVNQDGASNGMAAPNGPAQERLIRQALAGAGLTPADVDVVEGHGTGTTLGDPIEVQALLATYGQQRPADDSPLLLGSIKSNLGHTQAAAGVAGVIKMVLAMRHCLLPRTLHAAEPSTQVDWSAGAVRLLTEPEPWPRHGHPRRAGVSSFGVSGTNAHLIIEEPPQATDEPAVSAEPARLVPWVISGKTPEALRAQAGRLRSYLDSAEVDLAAAGRALATTRAALDHRAVALGATAGELGRELDAVAAGTGLVTGVAQDGKLAFLFPGQGAQRAGMGAELYGSYPVFARALDAVCEQLDPWLPGPLRAVMFAAPETEQETAPAGETELAAAALHRTEFTQCALFAFEVALFRLVESWGVVPDLLLGHSVGEITAAHVAGVLSLADACALVAARGRLMQALPAGGAMVAVQAPEQEVLPLLTGRVGVAAVNGPAAVVLSGAEDELTKIADELRNGGRKVSRLQVSHAFHSPLMEPMLAEFRQVVLGLTYHPPVIRVVSTLADGALDTPEHWVRHVRETVRFAAGISQLTAAGATRLVELGPDGVLTALAADCLDGPGHVLVPLSRRQRSEPDTLLAGLARLHTSGLGIDWGRLFAPAEPRRVDLPAYAFERRHYWLHPAAGSGGDAAATGQRAAGHPMLSAVVPSPDQDQLVLTGRLSVASQPWLADHGVLDTLVLPGTGYVELALRAGAEVGCELVEELAIEEMLTLQRSCGTAIQVVVGAPDGTGQRPLTMYSRSEDAPAELPWIRHVSGFVAPAGPADPFSAGPQAWPPAGAKPLDISGVYDQFADHGMHYGPAFRGLRRVWRLGDEVYAEVALPDEARDQATQYRLHPALLDSVLTAADFLGGRLPQEAGSVQLPFSWRSVRSYVPGAGTVRARLTPVGQDSFQVALSDSVGTLLATVGSLLVRPVPAARVTAAAAAAIGAGQRDSIFRVDWKRLPLGAAAGAAASGWAAIGSRPAGCGDDMPVFGDLAALASALDSGMTAPEVVVLACAAPGTGLLGAVRDLAGHVLSVLSDWPADERFARSRLMVLTRGAVAVFDQEAADLVQAPVWGLVRSAQEENPDRFLLVDVDGSEAATSMLAVVAGSAETEAAVRGREIRVPRLVRVLAGEQTAAVPWRADGTVLITGGTSGLGALFARHLVRTRGVRHLLLASRSGLAADGAADLRAELTALGAEVTVAACDVADRRALAGLLAAIPAAHPLTSVLHAAAVVDNALVGALTQEQLDAVLRPKADGAWHLHELTKDLELSAFVLFSSCVGLVIGAGQANYAAANRFVDALARHRRSSGLPAVSLAFGPWALRTALGGSSEDDLLRLGRLGLPTLAVEDGLRLFDEALGLGDGDLAIMRVDDAVLGSSGDQVPALLRDLARTAGHGAVRAASPAGGEALDQPSLEQRLAGLGGPERLRLLQSLVRTHIAAVRHGEAETIGMSQDFTELGLDSLAGIDLRNRLQTATGLRLPATLIFDYPTPGSLADQLLAELLPGLPDGPTAEPGQDEGSIRRAIQAIPLARLRDAGLLAALLQLAAIEPGIEPAIQPAIQPGRKQGPAAGPLAGQADAIASMSAGELVRRALAVGDAN
jgi:pimaricinolide synthase PimS1